MGPISADVKGAAIITYEQARPTIRINILTACFMVCFSSMRIPWERGPELPAPRIAVAPGTDYSALDTWLFPPSTDCSAFGFHCPATATDLTRRLALNALRSS
jgi:hypothetical protein